MATHQGLYRSDRGLSSPRVDLLAARRATALGVGLLSGGYGQDELEMAGAYRVYHQLRHLDEVGVRFEN